MGTWTSPNCLVGSTEPCTLSRWTRMGARRNLELVTMDPVAWNLTSGRRTAWSLLTHLILVTPMALRDAREPLVDLGTRDTTEFVTRMVVISTLGDWETTSSMDLGQSLFSIQQSRSP